MKAAINYFGICLVILCANRVLYAADDCERKLSNLEFFEKWSAKDLRPLVRFGEGKVAVPIYNATYLAFNVNTQATGRTHKDFRGGVCDLPTQSMRLLTIQDDTECLIIETSSLADSMDGFTHKSTYLAKDMRPIKEALRIVLKNDKIILMLGEKQCTPDTIKEDDRRSFAE